MNKKKKELQYAQMYIKILVTTDNLTTEVFDVVASYS